MSTANPSSSYEMIMLRNSGHGENISYNRYYVIWSSHSWTLGRLWSEHQEPWHKETRALLKTQNRVARAELDMRVSDMCRPKRRVWYIGMSIQLIVLNLMYRDSYMKFRTCASDAYANYPNKYLIKMAV